METPVKSRDVECDGNTVRVYYSIDDTTVNKESGMFNLTVKGDRNDFPRVSSIVTKEIWDNDEYLHQEVDKLVLQLYGILQRTTS